VITLPFLTPPLSFPARKFLINYVPPTEKTPLVVSYGPLVVSLFEANVALWNTKIAAYVAAFSSKYSGATATLFDAHTLFNTVNVSSLPAGRDSLTNFCSR
jgi:hypothetical protein